MDKKDVINLKALFLGQHYENRKFFKEQLLFLFVEYIQWRRNFFPSEKSSIEIEDMVEMNFKKILMKTEKILLQLTAQLKSKSMPFFSPHYLAHMSSETLMISNTL